jgi:hypothetical protein
MVSALRREHLRTRDAFAADPSPRTDFSVGRLANAACDCTVCFRDEEPSPAFKPLCLIDLKQVEILKNCCLLDEPDSPRE